MKSHINFSREKEQVSVFCVLLSLFSMYIHMWYCLTEKSLEQRKKASLRGRKKIQQQLNHKLLVKRQNEEIPVHVQCLVVIIVGPMQVMHNLSLIHI